MADRVAIMRAGRIEQFDTPEQVFEEPATEYVAGFIGMSNRLPARAARRRLDRSTGRAVARRAALPGATTTPVAVRLRPDDIMLAPVDRARSGGRRCVPGRGRRLAVRRPSHGRRRQGRRTPPARPGARAAASAAGPASCSWTRPVTVGFAPSSGASTSTATTPASPATSPSTAARRRPGSDVMAVAITVQPPDDARVAGVGAAHGAPARRARLPRRHRLPRAVPLYRLQQLALRGRRRGLPDARSTRPTIGRHDHGRRSGWRSARWSSPSCSARCWPGRRPGSHRGCGCCGSCRSCRSSCRRSPACIGWSFLLSPRPGYLNALLRNLPWWNHLEEGPVDVYTMPWIVIITGFGLTAFVYLFVSSGFANINSELHRGGPGERLVAGSACSSGSPCRCCGRCSSTAAAWRCCSASASSPGRCCSVATPASRC